LPKILVTLYSIILSNKQQLTILPGTHKAEKIYSTLPIF